MFFDINEPKSYQNGSKVSRGPHILTQFDEIYRRSNFFYLSVFSQITHQSIDLVKLNLRSKSHDSDVFGSYWENIHFWYRLLISFLRVIKPSDCDLNYRFGPKMLEYGRKKLHLLRFPQLIIVTNSPLIKINFTNRFS